MIQKENVIMNLYVIHQLIFFFKKKTYIKISLIIYSSLVVKAFIIRLCFAIQINLS